jgi:hypothetical protein
MDSAFVSFQAMPHSPAASRVAASLHSAFSLHKRQHPDQFDGIYDSDNATEVMSKTSLVASPSLNCSPVQHLTPPAVRFNPTNHLISPPRVNTDLMDDTNVPRDDSVRDCVVAECRSLWLSLCAADAWDAPFSTVPTLCYHF